MITAFMNVRSHFFETYTGLFSPLLQNVHGTVFPTSSKRTRDCFPRFFETYTGLFSPLLRNVHGTVFPTSSKRTQDYFPHFFETYTGLFSPLLRNVHGTVFPTSLEHVPLAGIKDDRALRLAGCRMIFFLEATEAGTSYGIIGLAAKEGQKL